MKWNVISDQGIIDIGPVQMPKYPFYPFSSSPS